MSERIEENGKKEQNNQAAKGAANEAAVQYEYGGYQIRVYFSGEKTLAQCVRNLLERERVC